MYIYIYICVCVSVIDIWDNKCMPDNVFIQCKFKLVPTPAQCWQDTDRTWSCWTLLQAVQPTSDAPVTHLTLRNVRGLVRFTAVFPPLGLPQYQSTSLAKSVMTPVTFFKSKTAKPPILKRRDQRSTAVLEAVPEIVLNLKIVAIKQPPFQVLLLNSLQFLHHHLASWIVECAVYRQGPHWAASHPSTSQQHGWSLHTQTISELLQ